MPVLVFESKLNTRTMLHAAQLRALKPITEAFGASTRSPIAHVALGDTVALAAEVGSARGHPGIPCTDKTTPAAIPCTGCALSTVPDRSTFLHESNTPPSELNGRMANSCVSNK